MPPVTQKKTIPGEIWRGANAAEPLEGKNANPSLRILFLSSVFPQPGAPIHGIYSLQLCRALAEGNRVRILSPQPWFEKVRGWTRRRSSGGEAAPAAGLEVDYPWFCYPPKVLRGTHAWFMWASVRSRVRRLGAEFNPDCVVSYWAYPDGAVAVRAARRLGVPAVVMVGGSDVLILAGKPRSRRRILDVLHGADAIVTVGQDLKAKMVELGVPRHHIHIVPRGVNTDQFGPGDRAEARRRLGLPLTGRKLLWVGRMVPVKGLDVLLDACARLRDREEDFHLYLVGYGPVQKALEADCRARGLATAVSFVGTVLPDRLGDWYRAADLTVLPSRSEGVPNVLRESLACGTPFVASRVGGVAELAREPWGFLVNPGDPAHLADTLTRALGSQTHPEVPPPCSGGWEESAQRLLEVIRPLVARQTMSAG
jgi:glycosyltransferase involved in cell wall biosynthesis